MIKEGGIEVVGEWCLMIELMPFFREGQIKSLLGRVVYILYLFSRKKDKERGAVGQNSRDISKSLELPCRRGGWVGVPISLQLMQGVGWGGQPREERGAAAPTSDCCRVGGGGQGQKGRGRRG
jgi:hypothetical protein